MKSSMKRAVIVGAAAAALLCGSLNASGAVAKSNLNVAAKPAVHQPTYKPSPRPANRPLRQSHTAVTQAGFLHAKKRHVSWSHKLYGPPGNLVSAEPKKHEANSRPAKRAGFVPRDNRRIQTPRAHGRIRRATAGCPTSFVCSDIGSDSPAGSSTYTGSGGSLSALGITAGGPGINDSLTSRSTQGFYYVYQSETSTNVSLSAQATGQTQNGSAYDTSGVAIRSGTGATNAYYMAYAVPPNGTTTQGGIYVDYQSTNGGSPVNLAYIPETTDTVPGNTDSANTCITGTTASCYLAVERINAPYRAQELEAFWSSDGTHWQAIAGSMVVGPSALGSTIDVGAYATSDSSGNSSTASFSSVSLQTADIYGELPTSCPPEYQCAQVGSSITGGQWSVPSNTWQTADPWTVSGSGSGLASSATSDSFQWVYQPINGDGNVSAQVGAGYEFPTPGSNYGVAQYGVQVRGSTSASAPYFAAFVSPCQGLGLSYRTSSGGSATLTWNTTPPDCTNASNEENGLGPASSISVMVARTGTSYQAYYNSGSGWTSYGSAETISAIPSQAPAGVFAASTYSGWQAWANFSDVTVSGDQPTSQEQIGVDGGLSASSPSSDYNGDYTESDNDIFISGGRGLPLGFSRIYNSLLASEPATTLSPYGNLGPGWTDNYDTFATQDTAGDITIQNSDGSQVTFTYSGGTYTPATHILATLQLNTGQTLAPQCPSTALVLTMHDQTEIAYYAIGGSGSTPSGALCEELDINGYPTELTYDSSSRLTTVTAYTNWNGSSFNVDRYLTVAYSGSGTQIVSVTSSAGTGTGTLAETYGYSSGNLASATNADSDETRYSYNPEGVLNEIRTPNQYAAGAAGTYLWYDTAGRLLYSRDAVAAQEGVSGVTSYLMDCSLANPGTCSSDGTQTTTIVDPLGKETQDVFADGMLTSETQGVGSSVAATANYSYDQNTLGANTTTSPADGSGDSYSISYTNWYGTGSGSYGDVQCSITPGPPVPITVSGASWVSTSGGEATLTFSSALNPPVAGSAIYVSGLSPTGYNGNFTVVSSSATSAVYALTSNPGTYSSGGTIAITQAGLALTGASQSGGTATLTFASSAAPPVGSTIVVAGVSNSAYDGTFQVTGSSSTTVQYAVSGSPGSSSGGSFYLIPGDGTSSTYNSYNETLTTTNSDEQPVSYAGACNTGTPTYTTTNYYGSSGSGICANNAPDAWLLACTVDDTGGSPATPTTNYQYDQSITVSGTAYPDSNIGDVNITTDPNGNVSDSVYDSYGNALYSVATGLSDQCSGCGTSNISSSTYEPDGQTATSTEPNGNVSGATASLWTTTYTYDAAGNQLTSTDPGSSHSITSASCSSGTATVSFSSSSNPVPPTNSSVVVSGVSPGGFNGTWLVKTSTSTSISYVDGSCPLTYISGGTVLGETTNTYDADGNQKASRDYDGGLTSTDYDIDDRSLATSDPGTALGVTGATCSGTTATVDYASTSNNPPSGSIAFVTGITPSGYNGDWVLTGSHSTYVTYTVPSCPGSWTSGGIVAPSASAETYDGDGNDLTSTDYSSGVDVTDYAYDALNRQTSETVPGTALSVTGYSWSSVSSGTCSSVGGKETITYTAVAGTPDPIVNGWVVVTGVTPTGLNGTFQIAVTGTGTASYCQGSSLGTYSSGGTVTSVSYTQYFANGNTDNSWDGAGDETSTTYYAGGSQQENQTGSDTSSPQDEIETYDPAGNTLTDATGSGSTLSVTTSAYNDAGWTLTSEDQRGEIASYVYDDDGNVTAETDPGTTLAVTSGSWASTTCGGSSGEATLDFATNQPPSAKGTIVVSGVSPSGYNGTWTVQSSTSTTVSYCETTSLSSASAGGTIQVPSVVHNKYDTANRLISSCTDGVPYGHLCSDSGVSPQVTNTYDADGNTADAADASSSTTTGASRNNWDQSSTSDVGGGDQMGTATAPNSEASSTTYNSSGQAATVTTPDGNTKTYTYDSSGRVTKIAYSDDTPTVTYSYYPDGSPENMTDGSGTTTYTYDQNGDLATETDGNGYELQYTWDQAGDLLSETFPDGNTATYTYNQTGQMASASDWLGHTTDFSYDAEGNLTTATLPNSTVTSYSYNQDGQLDKIATTKSGTAQFSFDASGTNGIDASGNVQKVTTTQLTSYDLSPDGTSTSGTDVYSYDDAGREVSDTQTGSAANSTTSTYNDNGEIKSQTGTESDTFDFTNSSGTDAGTFNQLTGSGPFSHANYDADGNRICQGGSSTCNNPNDISFSYDAEDRLIEANWGSSYGPEDGGSTGGTPPPILIGAHETYSYDGNGVLQETYFEFDNNESTTQEDLVWSSALGGVPQLGALYTNSDGSAAGHDDYIEGPDGQPLEQVFVNASTHTPLWYYRDFTGTTRVLLNSSGGIDQTYNSDAWGNLTMGAGAGDFDTPLIFKNAYIDTTGLIYMQARWYDSTTGQFLSQDPDVNQTLKPFAYANDEPTTSDDPSGQSTDKTCKRGYYYMPDYGCVPNTACPAYGKKNFDIGPGWICGSDGMWKIWSGLLGSIAGAAAITKVKTDVFHIAKHGDSFKDLDKNDQTAVSRWQKEMTQDESGSEDGPGFVGLGLLIVLGGAAALHRDIEANALKDSPGACLHYLTCWITLPWGGCIPRPTWTWETWDRWSSPQT